jgi:hypothetical protein
LGTQIKRQYNEARQSDQSAAEQKRHRFAETSLSRAAVRFWPGGAALFAADAFLHGDPSFLIAA